MNNMSFKYKSVAQIALKDIAEYQRELLNEKSHFFNKGNFVTPTQLFTKEVKRLNRQLGLHKINKTKNQKNFK